MGKGDPRTRKGKIFKRSYGKARPRKKAKPEDAEARVPGQKGRRRS